MGLLPETFLESFEASAIAEGDIRALLQLSGKLVVDTMRPASGLLGRAGRGTFHAYRISIYKLINGVESVCVAYRHTGQ